MDNFKNFLINYRGAIIGGLISIFLLILRVYTIIIYALIIVAGMALGYYIQCNKDIVKDKIKGFIDKL